MAEISQSLAMRGRLGNQVTVPMPAAVTRLEELAPR